MLLIEQAVVHPAAAIHECEHNSATQEGCKKQAQQELAKQQVQ